MILFFKGFDLIIINYWRDLLITQLSQNSAFRIHDHNERKITFRVIAFGQGAVLRFQFKAEFILLTAGKICFYHDQVIRSEILERTAKVGVKFLTI